MCRKATSFDHLIGELLQLRGHVKAESPRCLDVDDQAKLGRLFDRQISGLGPPQYFVDVFCASCKKGVYVHAIAEKSAGPSIDVLISDCRHSILARRVTNSFTGLIVDRSRRDVSGIETLCREVGKDLVDVFGPRERKDLPAEAENISGMVELAALPFEVNKVNAFSGDKCQSGQAWNKLFQQLDTLGQEIESDRRYSRDIAFRAGEVFYKSAFDGVACSRDNGNCRSCLHESANSWRRRPEKHVRPPPHQLGGKRGSLLKPTIGQHAIPYQSPTLDPAEFSQATNPRCTGGVVSSG